MLLENDFFCRRGGKETKDSTRPMGLCQYVIRNGTGIPGVFGLDRFDEALDSPLVLDPLRNFFGSPLPRVLEPRMSHESRVQNVELEPRYERLVNLKVNTLQIVVHNETKMTNLGVSCHPVAREHFGKLWRVAPRYD